MAARQGARVNKIKPLAMTKGAQVGRDFLLRGLHTKREQGLQAEDGVIQVRLSLAIGEAALRRHLGEEELLHQRR